jgi:hypothetical protein
MPSYPEYEHTVVEGDTFDTLAKHYYDDKHAAYNLTLYNHLKPEDPNAPLAGKLKTIRVPEKLHVVAGRCLKHAVAGSDTFESIAEQHYGNREAATHVKRLCGLSAEKPADATKMLLLPKKLDEYTLQSALISENSDKVLCILLYPRVNPPAGSAYQLSL